MIVCLSGCMCVCVYVHGKGIYSPADLFVLKKVTYLFSVSDKAIWQLSLLNYNTTREVLPGMFSRFCDYYLHVKKIIFLYINKIKAPKSLQEPLQASIFIHYTVQERMNKVLT